MSNTVRLVRWEIPKTWRQPFYSLRDMSPTSQVVRVDVTRFSVKSGICIKRTKDVVASRFRFGDGFPIGWNVVKMPASQAFCWRVHEKDLTLFRNLLRQPPPCRAADFTPEEYATLLRLVPTTGHRQLRKKLRFLSGQK